jgi:hypothetical protein
VIVKHARADALERLETLLIRLRTVDGLTERSWGVFYRGSKAFLHFHEDESELYADVRLGEAFERFRATDPEEQARLLALVVGALSRSGARQQNP